MARIKIDDLPVMEDLSEKQMKGVFGGITAFSPVPSITELESMNLCGDDFVRPAESQPAFAWHSDAHPIAYQRTGVRSFYINETGITYGDDADDG